MGGGGGESSIATTSMKTQDMGFRENLCLAMKVLITHFFFCKIRIMISKSEEHVRDSTC